MSLFSITNGTPRAVSYACKWNAPSSKNL